MPGLDPGNFSVASTKDCPIKSGDDEWWSFIKFGLDPGNLFRRQHKGLPDQVGR